MSKKRMTMPIRCYDCGEYGLWDGKTPNYPCCEICYASKPTHIEFDAIDAGLRMYGFSSAKTIAERHGYPVLDVTEYMQIMARMGYVKEARGARGKKLYGSVRVDQTRGAK